MYKMGEGMLGRLNLGGAGAGLTNRGSTNEVSMSVNNLNIPKNDMAGYRNTVGVDKSMDNFKLGFASKFGS